MRNKQKIPAVFKENLVDLLKAINEHDAVVNGSRYCAICSTPMYIDNIQVILPEEERRFSYVCNSIQCMGEYKLPEKADRNG